MTTSCLVFYHLTAADQRKQQIPRGLKIKKLISSAIALVLLIGVFPIWGMPVNQTAQAAGTTFTDDFSDGVIDPFFTAATANGGSVSESGGTLNISSNQNLAGFLRSTNSLDGPYTIWSDFVFSGINEISLFDNTWNGQPGTNNYNFQHQKVFLHFDPYDGINNDISLFYIGTDGSTYYVDSSGFRHKDWPQGPNPTWYAGLNSGTRYRYTIQKDTYQYLVTIKDLSGTVLKSQSIPISSIRNGSGNDYWVFGDYSTDWLYGVGNSIENFIFEPGSAPPVGTSEPIVNNWNFGSDLSNWTVINPVAGFATPGTVSWVSGYSGSAKVDISGAPSDVSLVQNTIRPIVKGEKIRVVVAHTATQNFANWSLYVGGLTASGEKLHNRPGGQGSQGAGTDDLIWIADADYPAGTEIRLHTAVWPGTASFWWDRIEAVSDLEDAPIWLIMNPLNPGFTYVLAKKNIGPRSKLLYFADTHVPLGYINSAATIAYMSRYAEAYKGFSSPPEDPFKVIMEGAAMADDFYTLTELIKAISGGPGYFPIGTSIISAPILCFGVLTNGVFQDPPGSPCPDPNSYMQATMASPAKMMIVDSLGRRVGYDPISGQDIVEIPGANLTGSDTEPQVIHVPGASGNYKIVAEGTENGTYHLSLATFEGTSTIASHSSYFEDVVEPHQVLVSQVTVNMNDGGESTLAVTPPSLDNQPPSTFASNNGISSTSIWFTTNVVTSLSATDNLSGVAYSEYSFDDGATWNLYNLPFVLGEEGNHTVLYRSTDFAGNIENTQSVTVKIDKTAPEANVRFDSATKDLEVSGEDNLGGPVAVSAVETYLKDLDEHGERTRTYTLTDAAGNQTNMDIEIKREGHEIKAEVVGLRYGDNDTVDIPENSLKFEWSTSRDGGIKELEQKLEVEDLFQAKAKYEAKKGQTRIVIEQYGEVKQELIKPGLVPLKLNTAKGALGFSY